MQLGVTLSDFLIGLSSYNSRKALRGIKRALLLPAAGCSLDLFTLNTNYSQGRSRKVQHLASFSEHLARLGDLALFRLSAGRFTGS